MNHGDKQQVHLTKFKWQNIGKGAPESDNPYLKMYLVDNRGEDSEYELPFAIDLAQMLSVTPPTEKVPLERQYSQFSLWIISKGEQYTDWIFHPN